MLRRRLRGFLASIRNFLCLFIFVVILFVYKVKITHKDDVVNKIPNSAIKYANFKEQDKFKTLHIDTVKRMITKYNLEERVMNTELYGPLKPNAPIFVIFVDRFKVNLKYLLVSLTQVLGIEDSLVIFSHSSFDQNVNNLVKQIDFTRVLQIFYPYSVQVHPHEFPGYQPGDCPHDMDFNTAQSINCTGANSPDIHGRFRNPLLAQTKHYWWWTLNKVFENLSVTKEHKGIFTFLEDDIFLTEDFIYMITHMKTISDYITICDFMSLDATSYKTTFVEKQTYTVEISTWDPKDHFSVLSFDSSVWSTIAAHYYLFCYIDDHSWSRSLYYLSLNRKDGARFKVMSSTMPRAYKTSSFATYKQFAEISMMDIIFEIMNMQKLNKIYLFPAYLEVYLNIELDDDDFVIFDYVDNNGGWNDPRDKKMCNNITANKIKKVIMDMDHEFHQYELNLFV